MHWTTIVWRALCALTVIAAGVVAIGGLDHLPRLLQAALMLPGLVCLIVLFCAARHDANVRRSRLHHPAGKGLPQ